MNRICTTLIALLFFSINYSSAQTPAVVWQKCYGSNNGDYAQSIQPTSDGGYIVAGYVESNGGDVTGYHGNLYINDLWVLKLDGNGAIQWKKCLGGTYMETGADIHQTPDGGYIIGGSAASKDCDMTGNHGGLDYWVIKLTPQGDISWQKFYGGSMNEYAYSIDMTSDGGYIVAGLTESINGDVTVNHGYRDFWVIKINSTGVLQWQKSIGGSADDAAYSVRATGDGGCIVAGYTESTDGDMTGPFRGRRDSWIVKLGNGGVLEWQKNLGGTGADEFWSVQLSNNGGYIVAGYSSSNDGDVSGNHHALGGPFSDFWVVRLDYSGTIVWQKCYGGDFNDNAFYIQNTPDGGYVVAGAAESNNGDATCNGSLTDMWVIKISNTGVLQWQKGMGGGYYDQAMAVQPLSDGTFIVAGYTCSVNVTGYKPHNTFDGTCADYWIVKLSAPVASEPNPVVTIQPASGTICTGTNMSASFTASVSNAGVGYLYQWKKNGIPVGTSSATYTASDLVNNDALSCTVIRAGACDFTGVQGTGSVTIHTNGLLYQPQITISTTGTVICDICTPVTFTAAVINGGPSPVYQWKVNGVSTGDNKNVFTTTSLQQGDKITCEYSDNTGCIINGFVVSNMLQMSAGSGGQAAVSINTAATAICAGSPVLFTASPVNGGTNPTYQWKVNGVNAGTNSNEFTSATLANGDIVTCIITPDPLFACVGNTSATSNSITITVDAKHDPHADITTISTTVCTGASVTFLGGNNYLGSNPSYQWKVNGVNVGTNSNMFITSTLANGDQVSCVMTADPQFTCANSPTAVSNVIVMTVATGVSPSVSLAVSGNDVCVGDAVTFTATPANAGASPNYQWVVNDRPLNSTNGPVLTRNGFSNGDKVYCMVVPAAGTCSTTPVASNIITVILSDLPVVNIIPADTLIKAGEMLQLKTIIGGNVESYVWSPANKLQDAALLDPSTIRLTENTVFTLTVESDKGCRAVASANIRIGRPLFMPNAFTPNGNKVNDVFRIPPGVLLNLKEFSIFDRWGNRVFTTHDVNKGWDGTVAGQLANAGTYVYFITGTDDKGAISIKGQVVLVR